ncbi:uncharacterized protein LOC132057764 [Lycium ferocissimum]|uniref:uncharacterized protein LOC132057764 n=1 Tax=Lycium ferocissimum TaxID=112874 RepID=UPI002816630F|nr:uncharacterized protein LOC132057764 [Lycium ferocissimum]
MLKYSLKKQMQSVSLHKLQDMFIYEGPDMFSEGPNEMSFQKETEYHCGGVRERQSCCGRSRTYDGTRFLQMRDQVPRALKSKLHSCKVADNRSSDQEDNATMQKKNTTKRGPSMVEDIYPRLFSVYLKEKTWSCRRWNLTGIPCNHAIAAIWVKKDEPEMYVHECYTVEKYMKSYSPSILPIVSSEQWPQIVIEPPLPPIYKTQPGRLKKLRKKGVAETTQKESDSGKLTLLKASRKGRKKKCGSCGRLGNNSRICPILMGNSHSEVQQQQFHQRFEREGPSPPSNATEVTEVSSTIIESATSM